MKPAKEKPWWSRSKWYRRPTLSWRPYRVTGESAAAEYVRWLSEARGWDPQRAANYAHGMGGWSEEERAEAFLQAHLREAIALVEAA